MTAWLVAENALQVIRVDSIVSVSLVTHERDSSHEGLHPSKRLDRAERVHLMVGSRAGDEMCALTCPGRDALRARAELMTLVEATARRSPADAAVYVHASFKTWPSRRPAQIWSMAATMPEPDFVNR